jgi:type IV secretory pathway TraG/TraD family ATPase VirD4
MDFDKAKTVKNPFRLLFLIDEFPSLGKMEIFETAMAVMGGFGLKAYLITQDFEQLYKAYGQNETIVSNCHVRIVYAPNNQKTAQLISEMTGKRTIRHATVSYSGARTSSAQNQMSTSVQLVERQLMTADEISKLRKPTKLNPGQPDEKIVGPGDMLIFVSGERPIYGVQILFFLDKEFTLRSKISPPLADSTSLYKAPTEPERPRSMHLLPAPAESQGDSIVSLEQNPHLTEITNKKRKEADDTQAPKLAQTRVVPVDDTIITETAAQFERDSQQEREDEEDYEQDEHDTFDAPPEELAVTPTANFTQENAK